MAGREHEHAFCPRLRILHRLRCVEAYPKASRSSCGSSNSNSSLPRRSSGRADGSTEARNRRCDQLHRIRMTRCIVTGEQAHIGIYSHTLDSSFRWNDEQGRVSRLPTAIRRPDPCGRARTCTGLAPKEVTEDASQPRRDRRDKTPAPPCSTQARGTDRHRHHRRRLFQ